MAKPLNHEVKFNRKSIVFQLSYFQDFMKYLKARGYKSQRNYILHHSKVSRGLVVVRDRRDFQHDETQLNTGKEQP